MAHTMARAWAKHISHLYFSLFAASPLTKPIALRAAVALARARQRRGIAAYLPALALPGGMPAAAATRCRMGQGFLTCPTHTRTHTHTHPTPTTHTHCTHTACTHAAHCCRHCHTLHTHTSTVPTCSTRTPSHTHLPLPHAPAFPTHTHPYLTTMGHFCCGFAGVGQSAPSYHTASWFFLPLHTASTPLCSYHTCRHGCLTHTHTPTTAHTPPTPTSPSPTPLPHVLPCHAHPGFLRCCTTLTARCCVPAYLCYSTTSTLPNPSNSTTCLYTRIAPAPFLLSSPWICTFHLCSRDTPHHAPHLQPPRHRSRCLLHSLSNVLPVPFNTLLYMLYGFTCTPPRKPRVRLFMVGTMRHPAGAPGAHASLSLTPSSLMLLRYAVLRATRIRAVRHILAGAHYHGSRHYLRHRFPYTTAPHRYRLYTAPTILYSTRVFMPIFSLVAPPGHARTRCARRLGCLAGFTAPHFHLLSPSILPFRGTRAYHLFAFRAASPWFLLPLCTIAARLSVRDIFACPPTPHHAAPRWRLRLLTAHARVSRTALRACGLTRFIARRYFNMPRFTLRWRSPARLRRAALPASPQLLLTAPAVCATGTARKSTKLRVDNFPFRRTCLY